MVQAKTTSTSLLRLFSTFLPSTLRHRLRYRPERYYMRGRPSGYAPSRRAAD